MVFAASNGVSNNEHPTRAEQYLRLREKKEMTREKESEATASPVR